jgi:Uma2 family endonuclease
VLRPPPDDEHDSIADLVNDALSEVAPDGCDVHPAIALAIPLRLKLLVPDLAVLPRGSSSGGPDNQPVPAELALLVVEIAARGTDLRERQLTYAHAGVPRYLLIDRFDEAGPGLMLFSDPVDGRYRCSVRVPFGRSVLLPEPFNLVLVTSGFPDR